jgi:hypothetical protein
VKWGDIEYQFDTMELLEYAIKKLVLSIADGGYDPKSCSAGMIFALIVNGGQMKLGAKANTAILRRSGSSQNTGNFSKLKAIHRWYQNVMIVQSICLLN